MKHLKKAAAYVAAWTCMIPLVFFLPPIILTDYLRGAEWPGKLIEKSEGYARWGDNQQ